MQRLGRFKLTFAARDNIINGSLFNVFNGMIPISVENDIFSKITYYVAIDDSFEPVDFPLNRVEVEPQKIPEYNFIINEEGDQIEWVKAK